MKRGVSGESGWCLKIVWCIKKVRADDTISVEIVGIGSERVIRYIVRDEDSGR